MKKFGLLCLSTIALVGIGATLASCGSSSKEIKVCASELPHADVLENCVKDILKDKGYTLKFEDPAEIKNWVENERIANLNNTDIDWIKQYIEYYEKIGRYIKNIISAKDRPNELIKQYDGKTISALFEDYNNKLDASELKSIRMCIQVFYFSSTDSVYNNKLKTCENQILNQKIKDGTTHYELTPQCFKDIYDKVK